MTFGQETVEYSVIQSLVHFHEQISTWATTTSSS